VDKRKLERTMKKKGFLTEGSKQKNKKKDYP